MSLHLCPPGHIDLKIGGYQQFSCISRLYLVLHCLNYFILVSGSLLLISICLRDTSVFPWINVKHYLAIDEHSSMRYSIK